MSNLLTDLNMHREQVMFIVSSRVVFFSSFHFHLVKRVIYVYALNSENNNVLKFKEQQSSLLCKILMNSYVYRLLPAFTNWQR